MKNYWKTNKKILTVLTALTVVILLALVIVSCKYFKMSNDAGRPEYDIGIEAEDTNALQSTGAENGIEGVEKTETDAASEWTEAEQIEAETLERWEYLRDTVKDAVENPRMQDAE